MGNVTLRNLLAEMGQAFKDWADAFFDKDGENIDRLMPKEEALNEFIKMTNTKGWTTNKFTKALRAYCRYYGFVYNPKNFQNSQGRISKKIDGTTKDMIYIQTQLELKPEELHDENVSQNPKDSKPF